MEKEPLAPIWFHIWFILFCVFLWIGGVIDAMKGGAPAEFNPWGAALGVFSMYVLVLAFWKYSFLLGWVSRLPIPLIVSSVLAGWLFAEIDELVNYPFNPLMPGISLSEDILLTTPMYICAHMIMIHGVHMVIPKLALDERLKSRQLKESKMKYVLGICLPALGTGIGIPIALFFAP